MATSLEQAKTLVDAANASDRLVVCAPHIVLSPTYRRCTGGCRPARSAALYLGRARYGWSGPWWGKWFYQQGGGALFDLGVYNLTSLCGFFGSVQRVTAMVGVAIPEREVEGEVMKVQSDDNAHVVLDFGDARFASIAYRLHHAEVPLAGDRAVRPRRRAPDARRRLGAGGLRAVDQRARLVGGRRRDRPELALDRRAAAPGRLRRHAGVPTVTRPEHAYHALEVMLAAKRSAEEGRVIEIESTFPALDYSAAGDSGADHRRLHDPRST